MRRVRQAVSGGSYTKNRYRKTHQLQRRVSALVFDERHSQIRARDFAVINIRLQWPPTVNNYTTVARGRKILSDRGRKYKRRSILELMEQHAPRGLKGRLEVKIDAYPPDKRKRDLDNLCKPILDSLQDYGMFADDEQIDVLRIRRREITRPGHVRVYISEILPCALT
ncbi:hypothetical protein LCGC14_2901820 [marine sediment metagenome]|uniref:Uncharacterized protein n=1 Tax=marine sediment metagenome TaxID=412755 RepID=A0A0F8XUK1_9ZZZZ